MKIDHIDPTSALNQGQAVKPAKAVPTDAFSDILSKQIAGAAVSGESGQAAAVSPGVGAAGVSALMMTEAAGIGATSQTEQTVMENMDSLLSDWENYAGALTGRQSGAGLKQAYGLLENIETGVRKLKEETPNLGKDSPLANMVNELEVMTVTEKIKFNRGDYLA